MPRKWRKTSCFLFLRMKSIHSRQRGKKQKISSCPTLWEPVQDTHILVFYSTQLAMSILPPRQKDRWFTGSERSTEYWKVFSNLFLILTLQKSIYFSVSQVPNQRKKHFSLTLQKWRMNVTFSDVLQNVLEFRNRRYNFE